MASHVHTSDDVIKTSYMNDGWQVRGVGGIGDLQFCLPECEEVGAATKGGGAMEVMGVGRIVQSSSLIRVQILFSVTRETHPQC